MRRAALILVLAWPLAAASADAPPGLDVQFTPPGQVGPDVGLEGGTWALLIFSDATAAEGNATFPQATSEEFHEAEARVLVDGIAEYPVYTPPVPPTSKQMPPLQAGIAFPSRGPASLFIQAGSITLGLQGRDASLAPHDDGRCLHTAGGRERFLERSARLGELCPEGSVAATADPGLAGSFAFSIEALDVSVAEWHNADVHCLDAAGPDCPTGGTREEETVPTGANEIRRRSFSFQRITTEGGRLALAGSAGFVIAGGPVLDLAVAGHARLPLASAPPACAECVAPDGQTLQIDGNFSLAALQRTDGGLSASIEGDLAAVRFDEASLDPQALLGLTAAAATVAAVGLALAAKGLLATLFTRMTPERSLANRSRRAIMDHVKANPGATFREVMRGTGLAAGSVQFHARVLKAAGLLDEASHANTRRFFPAGHPERGRTRTILLREPPLAALHALIQRQPWLSQSDVLDAADRDLGWSRSTTQHRLTRLVKGDLLQVRLQGRFKLYAVSEAGDFLGSEPQPVPARVRVGHGQGAALTSPSRA